MAAGTIAMIKYDDGHYVPQECCTMTNPATSGGASQADDIDLPCGAGCEENCNDCIIQKIMDEYAEITYQSGWIPCSERQPEETGFYMTTKEIRETGKRFTGKGHFGIKKGWDDPLNFVDVVAWRPLPEAYKD